MMQLIADFSNSWMLLTYLRKKTWFMISSSKIVLKVISTFLRMNIPQFAHIQCISKCHRFDWHWLNSACGKQWDRLNNALRHHIFHGISSNICSICVPTFLLLKWDKIFKIHMKRINRSIYPKCIKSIEMFIFDVSQQNTTFDKNGKIRKKSNFVGERRKN